MHNVCLGIHRDSHLRDDVELLTVLYILTCLVGSEGTDISSYVLFQEADNIPLRKMNRATNHLFLARVIVVL